MKCDLCGYESDLVQTVAWSETSETLHLHMWCQYDLIEMSEKYPNDSAQQLLARCVGVKSQG